MHRTLLDRLLGRPAVDPPASWPVDRIIRMDRDTIQEELDYATQMGESPATALLVHTPDSYQLVVGRYRIVASLTRPGLHGHWVENVLVATSANDAPPTPVPALAYLRTSWGYPLEFTLTEGSH